MYFSREGGFLCLSVSPIEPRDQEPQSRSNSLLVGVLVGVLSRSFWDVRTLSLRDPHVHEAMDSPSVSMLPTPPPGGGGVTDQERQNCDLTRRAMGWRAHRTNCVVVALEGGTHAAWTMQIIVTARSWKGEGEPLI